MSAVLSAPGRGAALARTRERVRAAPSWLVAVAGLAALVGVSAALRSTALHSGFWIDEGLSVGIATHHFWSIPSVLGQDGSPPLYYLVLGLWIRVFGDGQATTHVLSLLFALAVVPTAWWAAGSIFGRRAAWVAAALATTNPFLTYYAQETRMYALVVLLGLVLVTAATHLFVHRDRRAIVPFGLSLALVAYAHNWGLFLDAGTLAGLGVALRADPDRRGLLGDAALAYGLAALLFAPWLPTLLGQAAHTGAPWSERPSLADAIKPLGSVLGGGTVPLALLLAGGAGLASIVKERGTVAATPADERRVTAVWLLVAVGVCGLVLAFLASQVSPAFTGRYFAVFVGPILLLAGAGLAAARRLGLVTLAIVTLVWFNPRTHEINSKFDARGVAGLIHDRVLPGDLVVSVHPEVAPLLHYYFPPNLRWATSLGPMPDPKVFDWRDALSRLRATRPTPTLDRLVTSMRPGQTLVLVLPIIRSARWGAPWTSLVRTRSAQWQRAADRDPDLARIGTQPRFGHRPLPRGVRAVLYRRRSAPA